MLGTVRWNLEKIRASKAESPLGLEMKAACAAILLRWAEEESLQNNLTASLCKEPSKTLNLKRGSLAAQLLLASQSLRYYSAFELEAWATNLCFSLEEPCC